MIKNVLQEHGYIIIDSKGYSSILHQMDNISDLFELLQGNNKHGMIDDKEMNWKPVMFTNSEINTNPSTNTRGTRSKRQKQSHDNSRNQRIYSTTNSMQMSTYHHVFEDIHHCAGFSEMFPDSFIFVKSTVNIRLEGCTVEQFHFNMVPGYMTIHPYIPLNRSYEVHMIKVTLVITV